MALAAYCCELETAFLNGLITRDAANREAEGFRPPRRELSTSSDDELTFADERTEPVRRRLLHRLDGIRHGLEGDGQGNTGIFALAKSDADKRLITDYIKGVDAIIRVLADIDSDVQGLHDQLVRTALSE